jgi:hypothetical protein
LSPVIEAIDRVLEVRREPVREPSAPYGWDYAVVDVLGPTEPVPKFGAPAMQILVVDLLP